MEFSQLTFERLLQRGERARLAGGTRIIRESFKSTESAYWKLGLDQRGQFHATMKRAAETGAVKLEWSRQGGEERPLDGVVLVDVDLLAKHLGITTVPDAVQQARMTLERWEKQTPRVGELLATWEKMKLVRSMGPSSASDFASALLVMDAMSANESEDRVLRQVSVGLFGDSKRIEQLITHLDIMTAETITSPARHWEEVLGSLGITKEPQPFLIAGSGELHLTHGESCPLVRPFVGLANQAIDGYSGVPKWVLSIENLTTFHMAAKKLFDRNDGLIVYTGGMPSPAWRRAYRKVLSSLPISTPCFHWGDIDEGGLRIALVLRRDCVEIDRDFHPWQMNPITCGGLLIPAKTSSVSAMSTTADHAGWNELARVFREMNTPVRCEQESMPIHLPFG